MVRATETADLILKSLDPDISKQASRNACSYFHQIIIIQYKISREETADSSEGSCLFLCRGIEIGENSIQQACHSVCSLVSSVSKFYTAMQHRQFTIIEISGGSDDRGGRAVSTRTTPWTLASGIQSMYLIIVI